tara:strand:- start:6991 stop:7815 length:825 start_codon:yes stop_codon:yes gene_type:complete
MTTTHQIYLISDSTGETIDRIFLALKAQFKTFKCEDHQFSFTRTENQIIQILELAQKKNNVIILYTIVDSRLAKFLEDEAQKIKIPCFGVLIDLISNFSKLINEKASHIPSGQHVLDDEYYNRIEAIQFTMNHDDGKSINDINKSDIILLGASRTSKTPTSIYLANRGFKTSNIPLVNENSIPKILKEKSLTICIVGLTTEPERLIDVRRNRMKSLKESHGTDYTNLEKIKREIENSKKTFKKYNWPIVDVTRKSVEETAASIIKIYEIKKGNE